MYRSRPLPFALIAVAYALSSVSLAAFPAALSVFAGRPGESGIPVARSSHSNAWYRREAAKKRRRRAEKHRKK